MNIFFKSLVGAYLLKYAETVKESFSHNYKFWTKPFSKPWDRIFST